jgi:hypothetical protein
MIVAQETDYIQLSEETFAFISMKHPALITTKLNDFDVNKVANLIKEGRFIKIMYLYGHPFLIGMLTYFTKVERYELCKQITDSIHSHNRTLKEKLPTTLKDLSLVVV